jgi:hypothetical protein
MMPPMSGKQASAAATFVGKPVVPVLTVPPVTGGGVEGEAGSRGSGMILFT